MLAHLPLTFQHRAGVRPYTAPCGFAEPCVFDKQSPPPGLCPRPGVASAPGSLLANLREQFAEFLQHSSLKRLGMLYLSTCVGLGYGPCAGAVSWNPAAAPPIRSGGTRRPRPSPSRGLQNVGCIPIGCAFRPRLRGRLTLRRSALRRNPWTSGGSGFNAPCRYSCQHSRFRRLQAASRPPFPGRRNAPLPRRPPRGAGAPAVSAHGLSPGESSARHPLPRPVSCYAFFKWWLLLSQHPGCPGSPTSFPT